MKRRLTLAILSTAAAALLLAGVGTLLFARVGARDNAENELRSQAESTANLIDLAETRFGRITANDIQTVRSALCRKPGDTSAASSETEQLRALLCTPAESGIDAAKSQLCLDADAQARLDPGLSTEMRAAKDAFCANPTQDNLDRVRVTYCKDIGASTGNTPGTRRRQDQVRIGLCRLISARTQSRTELQNTLSRESIGLVTLAEDGHLVQGELPAGVTLSTQQADDLRAGLTVSSQIGNGAYAATAIDPTTPDMNVIVISRPSDVARGLVPWFLLASGITLLIGVGVAASLSRALTAPLNEAKTVTAQIADGNLAVRVPEHHARPGTPKDELDELAHSINTMAEALERSRGLERQFLLSVSHDLRTPLTSIRGYAEAIADGTAPDAGRAAGIILTESRRLERLVQDLLDLAKLDARRFTFAIGPIELNEVAGDSVDGFRREVEAAGLTLRFEPAPGPVHAFADPDRLQQVIANLVENALKFATTTITVRAVGPSTLADGTVTAPQVDVTDDGPGIAAEDLPHVFDRLYVTPAKPQRKEAGSGLGLAIVREVTEAMGGSVHAMARADGVPGVRMVVMLSETPPLAPPTPPIDSVRPS